MLHEMCISYTLCAWVLVVSVVEFTLGALFQNTFSSFGAPFYSIIHILYSGRLHNFLNKKSTCKLIKNRSVFFLFISPTSFITFYRQWSIKHYELLRENEENLDWELAKCPGEFPNVVNQKETSSNASATLN